MHKMKKLSVNKETICQLSNVGLADIRGGAINTNDCETTGKITDGCSPTRYDGCWSYFCPSHLC